MTREEFVNTTYETISEDCEKFGINKKILLEELDKRSLHKSEFLWDENEIMSILSSCLFKSEIKNLTTKL